MRQILASLMIALWASALGAQQVADATPQVVQTAPAILTVDVERLFAQSQFGQRIAQEYATGRTALANENRVIADALREEEIALAEQRAEMAPALFRVEAEAFDDKAQGIRRAQDAKERALEETLSSGRDQFLVVSRPILGQLMVDRGAFAILDQRAVLLSLGSIDVTDIAIERVNTAIGDGSALDQPPAPESPEGATADE